MPSDNSIAISQTIPGTVTIVASGASHLHAYVLQPDCDCSIQFFESDGTTPLTGLIHIPAYKVLSEAGYLFLINSDSGIKLSVVGNSSGKLNGFITYNA